MFSSFAFLDFSTPELIIILVIILLLFGSKKLPELSRSIGQSVKELRGGMNDNSGTNGKKDDNKKEAQAKDDSNNSQPKA